MPVGQGVSSPGSTAASLYHILRAKKSGINDKKGERIKKRAEHPAERRKNRPNTVFYPRGGGAGLRPRQRPALPRDTPTDTKRKGDEPRMQKKDQTAKNIAMGLAAASAVGAGAYLASRNQREVKKMAKKVARGAEKAVLDIDRMASRYF